MAGVCDLSLLLFLWTGQFHVICPNKCPNLFGIGEVQLIFRHEHLLIQSTQRVLDKRIIFPGAEQQTDRRIVPVGHEVFADVNS